MLLASLGLLCLAVVGARAQDDSSSSSGSSSSSSSRSRGSSSSSSSGTSGTSLSTLSTFSVPAFTGSEYTYASPTSQITVSSSSSTANSSSTSNSLTQLVGGPSASANGSHANATSTSASTSTSSAPLPSNTLPCNGYPEFCNRKFSNITYVCSHNSAFVIPNNAASNQDLPVTTQLNDGVRMLQGETHLVNNTLMNCHTTCSLLNAGTLQSEMEVVAAWLRSNPYDVVSWLLSNSDLVNVEHYVAPIQNSGLGEFAYEPAYVPQHREQWPTLGDMILSNKRIVFFMDYNANQTAVPYILDQYTHVWQTAFSPTNRSFPCDIATPPGLSAQEAERNFMYLANHNLNTAVDLSQLLGTSTSGNILIPNTAEINSTNGLYDQLGQLGAMVPNCTDQWRLPPNFLVVDYYNRGDPYEGSVFEVAAKANGVTYNRNSCCGKATSAAGPPLSQLLLSTTTTSLLAFAAAVAAGIVFA